MLRDYPRHHLWPHLWGNNAQHEVLSLAPPFKGKCGELDHGGRNEGTPKGLVIVSEDEPTKSVQTEKRR